MNDLQNAVRETISYKLFRQEGKKHIYEDEYRKLRSDIVREAWGELPQNMRSLTGSMIFYTEKHGAVRDVLREDGISIHMNDEYELTFADWYKQQGPAPKSFPAKLDYYSKKRQEFDEFYKKEKECWDSENTSKNESSQ